MNTKIISRFACSLLFLLITNVLFSQAPAKKSDLNNTVARSGGHESKISNSGNASIRINKKVQKYFTGSFAGVTGQNWSMAGKNFHCSFQINGIPASVLFTKNGSLIYFVMHGNEKNMPSDIRKIVKSEYFDYTITNAIEVKQNKKDIWIVKMQEDCNHITVRVEDGEMEVVQTFKELL